MHCMDFAVTDNSTLYLDLISPGRTKLSREKPLSRVLSAPLVVSTLAQLVVVVLFQLLVLMVLRQQAGYVRTM